MFRHVILSLVLISTCFAGGGEKEYCWEMVPEGNLCMCTVGQFNPPNNCITNYGHWVPKECQGTQSCPQYEWELDCFGEASSNACDQCTERVNYPKAIEAYETTPNIFTGSTGVSMCSDRYVDTWCISNGETPSYTTCWMLSRHNDPILGPYCKGPCTKALMLICPFVGPPSACVWGIDCDPECCHYNNGLGPPLSMYPSCWCDHASAIESCGVAWWDQFDKVDECIPFAEH